MGLKATLSRWLGIEKQSDYVRSYFYMTNMRASIYMSIVVISLEVWMIIRMIRTIFTDHLQDQVLSLTEKYFSNYFILLSAGLLMLLYAIGALRGIKRLRWTAVGVIVMSAAVCAFEVWMLLRAAENGKSASSVQNYITLLAAGIALIVFSVMLIRSREIRKWQSLTVMYIFSYVCIDFGIIISANSYYTGGQILTFLTMELFVICLLTWRPLAGFLVLTVSYTMFYLKIADMIDLSTVAKFTGVVDFSNVPTGLGDGIKINGFTMWLSTLLFAVANYNKTLSQALKDEDLEQMNAHLSKISEYDELTGIHNMVYFRSEAEKLLGYVTTDRGNSVFLFMDIENFKSYNEKYGFNDGNELLTKTAAIIAEQFSGSLVSRFSDDHFVVLTHINGCREKVEEISAKIHGLQREVHLDLKCGAYLPADDDSDPSVACDRARFACNSIKKRYQQSFRIYDKELEQKFRLKQYIVNNIDTAIAGDYIKVFYQPVVETKTGHICGLEALARWQDPNYGLLPPAMFIETLEEYRQIHKLDQTIAEIVCRDYREAAENGKPFVPVSLNFSRLDFELYDVPAFLNELIGRYRVPKGFLDIEVTESALTERQELLQRTVEALRGSGYKVWLDDFGSGYSSLNVLKDYQFDVLKIDMKFLSGFGSNVKSEPILKHIVQLTEQLNMISLTEGVETREQFEFLRSIGCRRVQGYLFSKPCPKEELESKVAGGELVVAEQYAVPAVLS